MQQNRLTVAIVFGGRSAEHDVSVRSAASVFQAMSPERYEVVPVLITRAGAWYRMPTDFSSFAHTALPTENDRLLFSPDPADKGFLLVRAGGGIGPIPVDVIFPVLHGTYGEDGTLQGLLELANVPYVGCGVLASAVGMDKVLMKCAFRDIGLSVGPFFWFLRSGWEQDKYSILERMSSRPFPLFVKPANLGSSVGISKVTTQKDCEAAVNLALSYDRKVLVEDAIAGRELEVSVLGNDEPVASVAGEVIAQSDFYDYEEKYLRDTAELIIPADLEPVNHRKAGTAATTAFKAVDGSGLARVDMFLTPDGRIIVNEINTLPGFTSISMYPKLWEASGLPYDQLIDKLVDLAMERHRDKQLVSTDR
ncbi:MAG: D-alanine--D-alanine ligase [Deltaproteobacteria bacterium]|nr:D-alanine--D-alanine ligase [Deltaproteobacteria bacterium]